MKKLKTPEDYLKDGIEFWANVHHESIPELIRQAQRDAIDVTIENCADEADADFTYLGDDLREIGAECIEVYVIKQSLLDVGTKMKEELK